MQRLDNLLVEVSSFLEKQLSTREFAFRMSAAGDCQRKMDYDMVHGIGAPDWRQELRMRRGTYLHQMWQDIWAELKPNDFIHMEKEIADVINDITIIGHPDSYIKSIDSLYELKSVGDRTYEMVVNQDHPIPAHYEQGNYYANVYGAKNILMHYFNVSNGDSVYYLLQSDPVLFRASQDKFLAVANNFKEKKLTPRPFQDPTGSPCWFCNHKDRCYEGFEQQVKEGAAVELDKNEWFLMYDHCVQSTKARSVRLLNDKNEKDLKSKIAKLLIDNKISNAKLEEFTVSVKLGSKNNPLVDIKEKKK